MNLVKAFLSWLKEKRYLFWGEKRDRTILAPSGAFLMPRILGGGDGGKIKMVRGARKINTG